MTTDAERTLAAEQYRRAVAFLLEHGLPSDSAVVPTLAAAIVLGPPPAAADETYQDAIGEALSDATTVEDMTSGMKVGSGSVGAGFAFQRDVWRLALAREITGDAEAYWTAHPGELSADPMTRASQVATLEMSHNANDQGPLRDVYDVAVLFLAHYDRGA
jgi:hypothetical protein